MKKGLWKRRAFAFLVAAAMVIPQGVYAAGTEGNETSENAITEEVLERVHENGCILPSDHEGDCVITPAENTEEPTERVHEEGCTLALDHEGDCVTEPERVHEEGCTLDPDHEGDCVTEPAESTEEQPERVHEDGCVLPSDHEGECEVEKQEEAMLLKAPRAEEMIYVASTGSDDGEGTVNSPYASLKKAVEEAADGATIIVKDDISVNELARIADKDITITSEDHGNPATVTRGDNFETANDPARSWYNPAMIEVTVSEGNTASLKLENIILDDAGICEGEYFVQTSTDGSGHTDLVYGNKNDPQVETVQNSNIVQDAIIAAYGLGKDSSKIILGNGAILKNFGGMSAVRVTGGATLNMEPYSEICDDAIEDRVKGAGHSFGPAGAVWVQSTSATIQSNAKIYGVVGRAVYVDGGSAEINGTISGIKVDKDMWNQKGTVLHVRGGATATVGGLIEGVDTSATEENEGNAAIFVENSNFTLTGTLYKCTGSGIGGYGALIYASLGAEQANDNPYRVCIDGTIQECSATDSLIYIVNNAVPVEIGSGANIFKNQCQKLIYHNTAQNDLVIEGSITENECTHSIFNGQNGGYYVYLKNGSKVNNNTITGDGAIFNFGANREIILEDGCEVKGNTVANGAVFSILGEGNCLRIQGGTVWKNVVNNGSLVAFSSGSWKRPSVMEINGGDISNNTVSHNIEIKTKNEKIPNKNSYLQVPDGFNDIYFEVDKKTIRVDSGTKLGNANNTQKQYATTPDIGVGSDPRSVAELNKAAENQFGCEDTFATFWAQNSNGTPVTVKMDDSSSFDGNKSVYVLMQETDEKGAPANDSVEVSGTTVNEDGSISFILPGNVNGYAVGLVQPKEDYGKMSLNAPSVVNIDDGKIDYTATYTLSNSLKTQLNDGTLKNIQFLVRLSSGLNVDPDTVQFTSEIFEISDVYVQNNNILTLECTLKEGAATTTNPNTTLTFTANIAGLNAGDNVMADGLFVADLNETEIFVPANTVFTKLLDEETAVIVNLLDMVVYMGGEHGYEGVVNDQNQISGSQSLPEPGFTITLPDTSSGNARAAKADTSSLEGLEFVETVTGKTWTAEHYGADSDHVYRFQEGPNQDPVRVEFTKADGTKVVNDNFAVGEAVNQKLHMAVYKGSVGNVVARINDEEYPIILKDATLEVRGTTNQVEYAKVTDPVAADKPGVKAASGTTFTFVEKGNEITVDPEHVALLFDDIINTTPTQTDRSEKIKIRAEKELDGMYQNPEFEMKYLDLVDTQNGNIWVKADKDVTVYWPYPAGTDQSTDFTILHFDGLHRSLDDVDGTIETCNISQITNITKEKDHLTFKVGSGGFSPFVLTWDNEGGSSSSGGSSHVRTCSNGSAPRSNVTMCAPSGRNSPSTRTSACAMTFL